MNDFIKSIIYGLILLGILLISSIRPAKADGDNYLVYTCCSWHAANHEWGDKDKHFQETNHGVGYEYEFSKKWTLSIGEYDNSIYGHTNYLGAFYYPVSFGNFKLGTFVGGMTGYSSGVEPIAIPTVTYETKNWGINLEVIALPPIIQQWKELDKEKAIFGLQFKVRIP